MTVDEKRKAVKDAYPWSSWSDRVDRMSDDQLCAIYDRLKKQNKV